MLYVAEPTKYEKQPDKRVKVIRISIPCENMCQSKCSKIWQILSVLKYPHEMHDHTEIRSLHSGFGICSSQPSKKIIVMTIVTWRRLSHFFLENYPKAASWRQNNKLSQMFFLLQFSYCARVKSENLSSLCLLTIINSERKIVFGLEKKGI